MVDRISIVPESRLRSLPVAAMARFAASIGLLTAVTALVAGLPLAGAVGIATALAASALAFHDSALYLDFDQTVFPSLVAALLVFGCGLVLRRILGIAASAWTSAALAFGLAATFVKLLVVLHPGLTLGDSVFHLNRLTLVREGTWYFTSQAPGGQFPYPIAFYVIVSKLPIGEYRLDSADARLRHRRRWNPGVVAGIDGQSRARRSCRALYAWRVARTTSALSGARNRLPHQCVREPRRGGRARRPHPRATERLVASARHRVGLRHRSPSSRT